MCVQGDGGRVVGWGGGGWVWGGGGNNHSVCFRDFIAILSVLSRVCVGVCVCVCVKGVGGWGGGQLVKTKGVFIQCGP